MRPRLFGRLRRDTSGATAVEFGFLAMPFIMIIFAVMETSLIFIGELTLDRGVEQVARRVRVGTLTTTDESAFRSALCDQVKFFLSCSKLKIDVKSYGALSQIASPKYIVAGDLDTSSFSFLPGASSTVTTIRVYYKWPIVTDIMRKYLSNMGDGSYLLASMTAFKKENY